MIVLLLRKVWLGEIIHIASATGGSEQNEGVNQRRNGAIADFLMRLRHAKLEEVLDGYIATFTGRSKRDEERFKKKWVAIFPGARLNALTPTALESAWAQLSEGRTPQTVNRHMRFLRWVLNNAVRDKIAGNPVSQIKMFREPAGKTRFLSPEEEGLLCEKIGAPYAGWIRLASLTGMRQMEQFSLRWEPVDLERGVCPIE